MYLFSVLLTCMCYPCSICYLGSRIGENMCMPLCVPASDITLRNKIRTVGGIKVNITKLS